MNTIRLYHHHAANGFPANARGIYSDAKRLRGRYPAEVSYFHRNPEKRTPGTGDPNLATPNPQPATRHASTNRVKRRPKLGTQNPKPETAPRPVFIDDGD